MFELRNRLRSRSILALAVGLLVFGSGCRVRKSPKSGGERTERSTDSRGEAARLADMATELAAPMASREGWKSLKATMRGRIVLGRGREFSSRLSLQALRGRGLRLSIQPFPLIEAARLWFTPEGVVLVDLINGVYTEVSYAALGERLGFTPTYDQVESLILGQIFTPSGGATFDALARLNLKLVTDGSLSFGQSVANGAYELLLAPSSRQLMRFSLADKQGAVCFVAQYSGAQQLGERTRLPERTSLHVYDTKASRGAELGSLDLEFQKVGEGSVDQMQINPVIKPSYERLSLDEVLKVLEKL